MRKLIFAAEDLEVSVIGRENMKRYHDINVFVQIDEIGSYYVNFNRHEVFFHENTLVNDYASNTVEIEFDETNLVPHSVCKNAEHHQCMTWKPRTVPGEIITRWKVIADYLDGVVELHDHDDPQIREVYLSAERPFVGKVCGYGEAHSSKDIFPYGDGKMIAIKVIPLVEKELIPQVK